MDWNRINVWTSTLYTLLHTLHLSKKIHFGNLAFLSESIEDSASWVTPECTYNSVLLAHPFGGMQPTFRRDPNKHFSEISAQVVKMLIQDLVVILDEMMLDILLAHGEEPARMPQGKIKQLRPRLSPEYTWAANGCLELVASRNVLTHAGACWNDQSIDIIRTFVQPLPAVGDKLVVGVPMLFRYRKAMRTLLNESQP